MLQQLDLAPAWSGPDQNGTMHASTEYAGQWLLLYFYPKDDTSGCTEEACGFRDSYAKFNNRISIVGVSGDTVESHKLFAEKYQLPFTLIADPDRTIIGAYGADGVIFPKRVTFLIGPDNTIHTIYHDIDTKKHAAQIDADLRSLGL